MFLVLLVMMAVAAIPIPVRTAVIIHVADIPFIQIEPAIAAFPVVITCRVAVATAAVIANGNADARCSYNNERIPSVTRLTISKINACSLDNSH
jgi:hypothetical protein